MRIYGPNGTTLGTPASNARRTGSTGFSLPDTTAVPDEVRSAAAPKAAGNIDALMALQGVERSGGAPQALGRARQGRARRARRTQDRIALGQSRCLHREPAARRGRESASPPPAIPGSTRSCPRSNFASKSNWPRPGRPKLAQPVKGSRKRRPSDFPVPLGPVPRGRADRQVPARDRPAFDRRAREKLVFLRGFRGRARRRDRAPGPNYPPALRGRPSLPPPPGEPARFACARPWGRTPFGGATILSVTCHGYISPSAEGRVPSA